MATWHKGVSDWNVAWSIYPDGILPPSGEIGGEAMRATFPDETGMVAVQGGSVSFDIGDTTASVTLTFAEGDVSYTRISRLYERWLGQKNSRTLVSEGGPWSFRANNTRTGETVTAAYAAPMTMPEMVQEAGVTAKSMTLALHGVKKSYQINGPG